MNKILCTSDRSLLSLSDEELTGIANALNEVCKGIAIPESEFQTRLGVSRELLLELLEALNAQVPTVRRTAELLSAWSNQGAVMVRAVTAYGDPVELSETEAKAFAAQVQQAIQEAS